MNYFKQQSDRLILRKATLKDIDDWIEFFENNDRLHFLGLDYNTPKKDASSNWINKQIKRYEEEKLGLLIAEVKGTKEIVGMGGILPRIINEKPELEIGYSIKPKYWGFGYATEIAKTLKNYGLQHLNPKRLISLIAIENIDSAKVAIKNGMQKVGQTTYSGMDVYIYSDRK